MSFGRVQYRSWTNCQMTDYTKLSIINQQTRCSVPFLLSRHSSAGIGITSGWGSYIPIETSNDSDDSHPQFFLSAAATNNYQAMNTLASGKVARIEPSNEMQT